jgi:putative copper resistance protein D
MTELVLPTLQQWLLFAGTVLLVGCAAWRFVVAPRAARSVGASGLDDLRRIELRVLSAGALAAVVSLGAWLLRGILQLVAFRDPFVPLSEDVAFLLGEIWGKVWMAQGLVVVGLVAALWRARAQLQPGGANAPAAERAVAASPAWRIAATLSLLLVATLALSSHAMGAATARSLVVTADGLHALAAGAWIGSLGIIVVLGRTERAVFVAQLRAFSPLAVASVAVLVTMGAALSWTHLQTPANVLTTSYGRVLSAKLGVAGLVFALGFWNWRRGLPLADSVQGETSLARRARWEVAFAGGVLLLTAVLSQTTKP